MPLLKAEDLQAGYGGTAVLTGVSLEVEKGEIVALIGGNGAGKSTLLNTLSGLVKATHGHVWLNDQELGKVSPTARVALGLIHVPERRELFPNLSVEENLVLGSSSRKAPRDRQEFVRELFPVLAERHRQKAGTLSGGEQQMLAIARGLMADPVLLMLDEPSLGLAPRMVVLIMQVVQRLATTGITILLVEQNAHLALSIANRAYVMDRGRITLSGTGQELLADSRIRLAYLGVAG